MDGHQLHTVPHLPGVAIGKEGHVGQVVLQGTFLAAGGLILIDRLLQLGQIVQPLLAPLSAEHRLIAALIEHGGEHFGDRPPLAADGEPLDQRYQRPGPRPLKQGLVQALLQGPV